MNNQKTTRRNIDWPRCSTINGDDASVASVHDVNPVVRNKFGVAPRQVVVADGQQTMSANIEPRLRDWATTDFREFPYAYWGVTGTTLLQDALRHVKRRVCVLPAFICPSLSAMLLRTGMKVVHVDIERNTLHMDWAKLNDCLSTHQPSDTVLLVDHTFGHPVTGINEIKHKYPELLIIEDCVRALGAEVRGRPVGHDGDWALFSLYKTTVGSDHGAILLTRSPCSIRTGQTVRATFRERASGIQSLRVVYETFKRLNPDSIVEPIDLQEPQWEERVGVPSLLCQRRFIDQLERLEIDRTRRRRASQEIRDVLASHELIRFVEVQNNATRAEFFLSFNVSTSIDRDGLVKALQRKGLALAWAWNAVPGLYSCFADTFPYGLSESIFVSRHVCHIPLWKYTSQRSRSRLIKCLYRELSGASK